jgi:hypothetical protein
MYASPSRLPQPGALLNRYGLVVCVISGGIKLDSYTLSIIRRQILFDFFNPGEQ